MPGCSGMKTDADDGVASGFQQKAESKLRQFDSSATPDWMTTPAIQFQFIMNRVKTP